MTHPTYTHTIETREPLSGTTLHMLPTTVRGLTYCSLALPHGAYHAQGVSAVADVCGLLLPECSSRGQSRSVLRAALRAAGAEVWAHMHGTHLAVHIVVPSKQVESVLRMVLRAVFTPTFSQREFREAQQRMGQYYADMQDDTRFHARRLWSEVWYGSAHPYALHTPEAYRNACVELVAKESKEWYTGTRTRAGVVAVCASDVPAKRVERVLAEAFETVAEGTREACVDVEDTRTPADATVVQTHHVPHKENVDVLIGAPLSLTRESDAYHALRAGVYILGGGATGRLFHQLREKHNFTYGSYATLSGTDTPYPLALNATAIFPRAVYDRALPVFQEVMLCWAEKGITAHELAAYKTEALGRRVVSLSSTKALVDTVFAYATSGRDIAEIDTQPRIIEALTTKEVNAAIHTITPTHITAAAAGSFE
jgi:zinc protease